jgi:hypothetical protein
LRKSLRTDLRVLKPDCRPPGPIGNILASFWCLVLSGCVAVAASCLLPLPPSSPSCSQSEPIFPASNSPAHLYSTKPRSQIATSYTMQSLSTTPRRAASFARAAGGFPEVPPPPGGLVSSPFTSAFHFSAPAHSTRGGRLMCGVSAGHQRFSAP